MQREREKQNFGVLPFLLVFDSGERVRKAALEWVGSLAGKRNMTGLLLRKGRAR